MAAAPCLGRHASDVDDPDGGVGLLRLWIVVRCCFGAQAFVRVIAASCRVSVVANIPGLERRGSGSGGSGGGGGVGLLRLCAVVSGDGALRFV